MKIEVKYALKTAMWVFIVLLIIGIISALFTEFALNAVAYDKHYLGSFNKIIPGTFIETVVLSPVYMVVYFVTKHRRLKREALEVSGKNIK